MDSRFKGWRAHLVGCLVLLTAVETTAAAGYSGRIEFRRGIRKPKNGRGDYTFEYDGGSLRVGRPGEVHELRAHVDLNLQTFGAGKKVRLELSDSARLTFKTKASGEVVKATVNRRIKRWPGAGRRMSPDQLATVLEQEGRKLDPSTPAPVVLKPQRGSLWARVKARYQFWQLRKDHPEIRNRYRENKDWKDAGVGGKLKALASPGGLALFIISALSLADLASRPSGPADGDIGALFLGGAITGLVATLVGVTQIFELRQNLDEARAATVRAFWPTIEKEGLAPTFEAVGWEPGPNSN